jgi:hypothetical protein
MQNKANLPGRVDGGHSPPYGTGCAKRSQLPFQADGGPRKQRRTDYAKQSQFPDGRLCETKPICTRAEGRLSVVRRKGYERQCGLCLSRKQSQLALPGWLVVGPEGPWRGRERPWKTRQGQDGLATETPYGVTTSRRRHAKQSQFVAGGLYETKPILRGLQGGWQARPTLRSGGGMMPNKANLEVACCAKQSQFPGASCARQTQFPQGSCAKQSQFGGAERDIPGAGWMARSAGQGKCGGAAPGNGVQHRVEWRGGGPEKTLLHPIAWATIRPIGGT